MWAHFEKEERKNEIYASMRALRQEQYNNEQYNKAKGKGKGKIAKGTLASDLPSPRSPTSPTSPSRSQRYGPAYVPKSPSPSRSPSRSQTRSSSSSSSRPLQQDGRLNPTDQETAGQRRKRREDFMTVQLGAHLMRENGQYVPEISSEDIRRANEHEQAKRPRWKKGALKREGQ